MEDIPKTSRREREKRTRDPGQGRKRYQAGQPIKYTGMMELYYHNNTYLSGTINVASHAVFFSLLNGGRKTALGLSVLNFYPTMSPPTLVLQCPLVPVFPCAVLMPVRPVGPPLPAAYISAHTQTPHRKGKGRRLVCDAPSRGPKSVWRSRYLTL